MRFKQINYCFILLGLCTLVISCNRRYKGDTNDTLKNPIENHSPTRNSTNEQNIRAKKEIKKEGNSISEMYKVLERSVFMVFATDDFGEGSQGSGFLIGTNIGITNYHVLSGSEKNYSIYINGEYFKVTNILDYSVTDDLDYAIFKIDNFSGRPLKIASRSPDIGEDVFAIGSPKQLINSLTKGTISGYRSNDRIQIDATIDHGSSGGALFNLDGEVVGITTSGFDGKELNFAVNIQAVPFKNFINY